MARIFVSYRRIDSKAITSRIYDRLVAAFGKENIFKDVDSLPLGRDFRGVLHEATTECQVMLVIIGSNWVNAIDANGNRRLDDPNDFVRLEVETGLQRDEILVIPLLVEGASMPTAAQLPESLRELAYNNAFTIHDDPLFHRDMDTLIQDLRDALRRKRTLPVVITIIGVLLVVVIVATVLLRPVALFGQSTSTGVPTVTQVALIDTSTPMPTDTDSPEPTFTATAVEPTATLTANMSRPTPTPVASGYVWPRTDTIRTAASTYSALVATVSSGELVKVYYPVSNYPESANWWLYVELQNSGGKIFGFIPWSSVDLYSNQTLVLASPTPTLTPTPSQQ